MRPSGPSCGPGFSASPAASGDSRDAANGQPAIASYRRDGDGVHRAYAIQVLTIAGPHITRITSFIDPGLFAKFGLPPPSPASLGEVPAPGR